MPTPMRRCARRAGRRASRSQRRGGSHVKPNPLRPTGVPPRGTFTVHISGGNYVYVYNVADAKAWPNEKFRAFANYMMDAFPGATDAVTTAYLQRHGVTLTGSDLHALPASIKTISYEIDDGLHAHVTKWMADNHPDIAPKRIRPGTRSIPRPPAPQAAGGAATDVPLEVTVHGPPPVGRASKATAAGKDHAEGDKSPADGSVYGRAGGSPHGIVQYEPLGELRMIPALKAYVANSRADARVFFETSHPFRAALNIFPNHASFAWTVYKDAKKIDTNLIETGRIEYQIDFAGPGTYTVSVEVSSDEFIDNKKLKLLSEPLLVVAESAREQQVFESNLVGADRGKPFERDANGHSRQRPTSYRFRSRAKSTGSTRRSRRSASCTKKGSSPTPTRRRTPRFSTSNSPD